MSNTHKNVSPWLGEKTYNFTKFCALILFPAVGSLYFSLAGLWGLPNAEEVVGTIVVIDTFLGVVLGISSAQYNASDSKYDGVMEVHPTSSDGVQTFQLNLNEHPEVLASKNTVAFKVQTVEEVTPSVPGDLPPVPPTTA